MAFLTLRSDRRRPLSPTLPKPRYVDHCFALTSWGATDVGRQRERNEDTFSRDDAAGLYVVIDGMGGAAAGDVAADMARRLVVKRASRSEGDAAERLREGIALANNAIARHASEDPSRSGMGCVLTAAIVEETSLVVGHVGDTRLYRVHDRVLEKLTRDHSPIGHLEDCGDISEAEAMRHPDRSIVDRALGVEWVHPSDEGLAEVTTVPVREGERYLLCSDGVTDQLTATDILAILGSHHDSVAIPALLDEANQRGGIDNATAILVSIGARFPS